MSSEILTKVFGAIKSAVEKAGDYASSVAQGLLAIVGAVVKNSETFAYAGFIDSMNQRVPQIK